MPPAENDPLSTQRDEVHVVATELRDAGFDDPREIGRGGFGVVFRCRQRSLDRTIAVKVMTSELDDENRARFFREQRAMGRLTGNPNIVNVLQVGTTGSGRPYLVMQFHAQGSLQAWISRQGSLPLDEALRIGIRIAGALESAHRLGIIHRDVKPANILLTDYAEPALTDFGIAHIPGGFTTTKRVITGSPAFTAPEVLRGDEPSAASDIYGLGATVFCALTGHAAFERRSGENVIAQFLRVTTDPVPDPRIAGIPDDVSTVIERAMAAEPHQRQPTAAAFGDELRGIQARYGFPMDVMAVRVEAGGGSAGSHAGTREHRSHSMPGVGKSAQGDLPLELTSFVGRRHELAQARRLLGVSRLVTLTGIGGVGKTRLALRVAAKVQAAFTDGVRIVKLGAVEDDSLVVVVVASELGLRNQTARPLIEILQEFLGSQKLLLVLDNCEQVLEKTAKVVDQLLHFCPNLYILATSREPLGISGEAVLRVPPLSVPIDSRPTTPEGLPQFDAVRLFADRAAAAVPTFALTEDNTGTIAQICRQLDGLPLPIELAAARLRAMSPEQIRDRLRDRYEVLSRGHWAGPPRQRTMRLCIDWSYELCSPQERLVWSRLSVFAGHFELTAAETICGRDISSDEFLDTLTSLVDKSILMREEVGRDVRFRMLEILRVYGKEKAQASGELQQLRREHREWCRQLSAGAAADWISPRQLEWITQLTREQSNLREAMEFSVGDAPEKGLDIASSLFAFWFSHSLFNEGRYWLGRLLACEAGQHPATRIKALYAASSLAAVQRDFDTASTLMEEARSLAEETTTPVVHIFLARTEGVVGVYKGDLTPACAELEKARVALATDHDLTQHVWILVMLGVGYDLLGESNQAIACFNDALSITEAHDETMYRSYTLWAMGVAIMRRGELERASRLLKEALVLIRRVDDRLAAAVCLEALAWTAGKERQFQRSAILLGAAANFAHSVGSSPLLFTALNEQHDRCVTDASRELGTSAFSAARSKGSQFDTDGAITYALEGEAVESSQRPHSSQSGQPSVRLTNREREVAALVAEGLTNRQIATRLTISPRTAQGHVEHLLTKLGFNSRAQIAAWFVTENA
ncbi:protein kinase domain-containing protein [Rhodococcus sp. NM-2]|uniref:protein kinase domain-containing protein n=1 Tax=Rhodococcus sp. NM-2 TaxID=3401174 RepID=UPI003AABAAA2